MSHYFDSTTASHYTGIDLDGKQYTVASNGTGYYDIHYGNGHHHTTSDSVMVNNLVNGVATLSSSGLFISTITDDEEKELQQLEDELRIWKRQQKLLKFQAMSSHLRQQIVDESQVRDTVNEMDNISDSDFDHHQRIQDLKQKKNPGQIMFTMSGSWVANDPGYRFSKILNEFTTQELMEAHASACMEEELSDG